MDDTDAARIGFETAHCFIFATRLTKAAKQMSPIYQLFSWQVNKVQPGISVAFLQAQEGLCDNNKQLGEPWPVLE
jgi:hypothetical protein